VSGAPDLSGSTVIYGGSFNPPHIAHQMTLLYLLEALGAARVLVVPARTHALGKELVGFEERVALCELMAEPFGERVQVSRVEDELGGAGRTYDLLVHLRTSMPGEKLVLSVGADILGETDRWYRWDDIVAMVPVVILGRAGYPDARALPVALPEVSSTRIRELRRAGESIRGLVPSNVARRIERRGLYA
jgi:nicotinate-nucleotide adenylyltransferase